MDDYNVECSDSATIHGIDRINCKFADFKQSQADKKMEFAKSRYGKTAFTEHEDFEGPKTILNQHVNRLDNPTLQIIYYIKKF